MEKKELIYEQVVLPMDRNYPKHGIKKPTLVPAFAIFIDGKNNSVIFQIIAPLYKPNNVAPKSEIDLIQIAISNKPRQALHELTGTEIMFLLDESAKAAVDMANEILSEKYPKVKKIPHCSHKQLKQTWDVAVGESKKDNPNFLEGAQWGIA